MSIKYQIQFTTFYNQFYVSDKNSPMKTDGNFWSDEADKCRVAVSEGVLGIAIANDELARVELNIFDDNPPNIQLNDYDHVVEIGLYVRSGVLQLRECPGSQIEFEVKVYPGLYRVRIYSLNLDDTEKDLYKLEVWPTSIEEMIILKNQ